MAMPKTPITLNKPPAEIPLVDLELLESDKIRDVHAFVTAHTSVTEEEYRALTIGDQEELQTQLIAAVQNALPPTNAAR